MLNFFVILGVERILPRNPAMNVFCDRQSLNDVGHGILLAAPPSSLHRTLLRRGSNCLGEFEDLAADRTRLAGIESRLWCD